MTPFTLLEMFNQERNYIISSHEFYVSQAEKRILSQFNNLDDEIEQIADEIYEKSGEFFNPDYDDPADFAEAAYERAQDHLIMLYEMRSQILLGLIAGMFHQFDKTLREWLERESKFWAGDLVKEKYWSLDIGKLYQLFENFGWSVTQEPWFKSLDACRLIVNVYKHGKGKALLELRKNHPEYFYGFDDKQVSHGEWFDHNSIIVGDDQFKEMSESIISFWKEIPERILNTEQVTAPQWLQDALNAEYKERKIKS